MKLVAKEEKRRRIIAEKSMSKVKKVQKPKSAKRRAKRKTVVMSDSETSDSESGDFNEISIESIQMSKKFKRASAAKASTK